MKQLTKCPNCGSGDTYYSHTTAEGVDIYKCRKCHQSFKQEDRGGIFGFGILGTRKEHYPGCRKSGLKLWETWKAKAALEITRMVMAHGTYNRGDTDALTEKIVEILNKNQKEWG